jgi:hypothetical protein
VKVEEAVGLSVEGKHGRDPNLESGEDGVG